MNFSLRANKPEHSDMVSASPEVRRLTSGVFARRAAVLEPSFRVFFDTGMASKKAGIAQRQGPYGTMPSDWIGGAVTNRIIAEPAPLPSRHDPDTSFLSDSRLAHTAFVPEENLIIEDGSVEQQSSAQQPAATAVREGSTLEPTPLVEATPAGIYMDPDTAHVYNLQAEMRGDLDTGDIRRRVDAAFEQAE